MPVQPAGLSDSRSNALLSLPQKSRQINPPARPHPGSLSSTRSVTSSDLMRIPMTLKWWSTNHWCEERAHLPPSLNPPPAHPGEAAIMKVEEDTDARLAEDSDDITHTEEMQRP